jgi:hypothetical protein
MGSVSYNDVILANTALSKITVENSNFMNIYRNAPAEVITAFNNSILNYIEVNKENTNKTLSSFELIIQFILVFCMISILVLVVLLIISIDRKRTKFWQGVFSIKAFWFSEPKSRSETRLIDVYD